MEKLIFLSTRDKSVQLTCVIVRVPRACKINILCYMIKEWFNCLFLELFLKIKKLYVI